MSQKANLSVVLGELVRRSEVLITYSARSDEIEPNEIPFVKKYRGITIIIPKTNFPNPLKYAATLKKQCADQKTCIIIPGRQFDISGTRYGRGCGWFDRLLSRLPRHWLRIGVAEEKILSRSRLLRQPHDQPVDWIICRVGGRWRVFETGARRR